MTDSPAAIARGVAVAVAVLTAFAVLVVAAEAIPDGPIARHLAAAADRGEYGRELAPDAVGGYHDGFTECVALGVGLGRPPQPMGLLRRALWAPRIGACEEGLAQVATLAAGGQVAAGPYYRYWNGHTAITRPVVAVAGVRPLRVVVAALLAVAAGIAAVAVGRRLGWMATAALATPLVIASNAVVTPAGSLNHAISLAAASLGTAGVAVATERAGWRGAAAAAAAGAALFVFVDLLTTPAIPWALAAFVAASVTAARGATTSAVAATGLAAGVAWPIAYAVTWGSRWLLAAAAHGGDVLSSIADVGRFRVSGEFAGVEDVAGAATRANLAWWWSRVPAAPFVTVLALLVVLWVLVVVRPRHGRRWSRLRLAALLASPALLVPAWYEVLSNHSQIHAFFTYRAIPAALGIGTAACVLAAGVTRHRDPDRG